MTSPKKIPARRVLWPQASRWADCFYPAGIRRTEFDEIAEFHCRAYALIESCVDKPYPLAGMRDMLQTFPETHIAWLNNVTRDEMGFSFDFFGPVPYFVEHGGVETDRQLLEAVDRLDGLFFPVNLFMHLREALRDFSRFPHSFTARRPGTATYYSLRLTPTPGHSHVPSAAKATGAITGKFSTNLLVNTRIKP